MKKLILILSGLFLSTNLYASTISLSTISADSTVNTFQTNFTTISGAINGNIEGSTDGGASVSNIKADTVYEINMADDANSRLRDSELLGITVDTTSSQATFVYTGLTVATSASLSSTITAGTAYVNGYRVTKTATSKTFTASKDTYIDLAQNGTFTYSEVAVGAAAPTVATNSARIAKITTDGTTITTSTDLSNRRLPGLLVPANYRDGMVISFDTTSTLIVTPGTAEINSLIVNKTANTTLTLGTAGDWAGGSSLRSNSIYGYVGMDASGNLKLHTTAPTHSNYGVSVTAGQKRYATWSSTVYRVLGWFYMNATGSGEIDSFQISNFKEGNTSNRTYQGTATSVVVNDTSYGSDLTGTTNRFYKSTDSPVWVKFNSGVSTSGNGTITFIVDIDGTDKSASVRSSFVDGTTLSSDANMIYSEGLSQGAHTITIQAKESSGTGRSVDGRALEIYE